MSGPIHTLPITQHKVKVTHYGEAWTLPNHAEVEIIIANDLATATIVAIDNQRLAEPIVLDRLVTVNPGFELVYGTKKSKGLVLRGSEVLFFEAEVKIASQYDVGLGPAPSGDVGAERTGRTPVATSIKWGQNGEQEFNNVTIHFKPEGNEE
ncbi:hypothetical protein TWF569_010965 [Orbilia oligospora]|uniref:Uncharacterized protein n=1 Tax=Orbilia oligospora TaxID=2813651 RepID=A0A7C8NBV0_ORBOL|nr:hypothetical protein TWF706_001534 [Orbilia oligospora]KAF3083018.1 hypothetical protein TWF103_003065 [Orbilia oligospora]KAF3101965.1 hypothetical protein TWF102_004702 [Orbilia oligospora]KAF3120350.1 hypothetical protein TWF594_003910 [Orbilia oligospora]KAF3125870.1 hypothetical protein TWF703_010690 [Orbilia oligospora]